MLNLKPSFNRLLLLLILTLISVFSYSQKKSKITYEADLLRTHATDKNITVLVGNVVFNHSGDLLYCDSAYFHQEQNKIEAYSRVRIKLSDTLNIYGDVLNYDGETKVAQLTNNVKLVDSKTTLTTNYLDYNRQTGIANYNNNGKIVNKENVLTSKIGYYFTNTKEFFFKNDVVLVNPKYTINSDTLMYNTGTEIAYFYGPTNITSKDNYIYCENGWYNTKTDISQFSKNAFLVTKNQYLKGDSLYYDRKFGYGKAFNYVTLIDTVKNVILKGNYIENNEFTKRSLITDSSLAIMIDDHKDSLFLHADTLRARYDTANNIELILAYNKTKFFRKDIQGMCDSLSYYMKDSIITMYYNPVLWTDKNQLMGDTIKLIVGKEEMKMMYLLNAAFIASESDTGQYNQIKGKNMVGSFAHNELYKVDVKGSSETIYYMKEEGSNDVMGINKAISSDMLIFIEKKELKSITFISKPEGTLYPLSDLPPADRVLKNFVWKDNKRPYKSDDVYKW